MKIAFISWKISFITESFIIIIKIFSNSLLSELRVHKLLSAVFKFNIKISISGIQSHLFLLVYSYLLQLFQFTLILLVSRQFDLVFTCTSFRIFNYFMILNNTISIVRIHFWNDFCFKRLILLALIWRMENRTNFLNLCLYLLAFWISICFLQLCGLII